MYSIIVCGSLVPDPLQTLEPIAGPNGPALKNEMMLPSWLDPWAGHALYEAANLAAMISNPRDLERPSPDTPADATRRGVTLAKYRKGEQTSAAKDEQASGNVSQAVK